MSDERRGYLVPARRDRTGRLQWAVPGIVNDLVDAVRLPGEVYRGEVDPLGDQAQRRAMDLAGMAVLGTVGRAGSSMLAAKGPMEYDAPRYPQRPFKADYPGEVPADAAGKLQRDIEGRPLSARYVAGRTEAMQGFDRPAGGRDELAGMVEALVGQPYRVGPRSEIGGHGGTFLNSVGRPTAIALADDLHPDDIPRVLAHELGHVIDVQAGPIPTDGLRHELGPIYHAQATGQRWSPQPVTPQSIGYPDADAPQEYMAEAIRNYLLDPNSIKSVAPETAARIRSYVNSHPEVSKTIQFNTAAPLIVGGGFGAAALAPTEARGDTMANWWEAAPVVASAPARQPNWWDAAPIVTKPTAQQFEGGVPVGGSPDVAARGERRAGMIPAGQMQAPGTDPVSIADHGMRMAANGITFNMADRVAGVADLATGRADTYDEAVRGQRGQTQAIRDAAPVAAGIAEAAGGVLGGVGMIKSGATLAGRMGSGILPRMAAFGVEGAGYGAAHGAGATYSDDPWAYAQNAGTGAGWGASVGAGLPIAGAAASALFRGGQAIAAPAIDGAGRMASAFLRGGALADDMSLQAFQKMGPEAMLVDAGPSMLGLGQGAGTGIGQGRTDLVNALRTRDQGTGQRLAAALDEHLGPAPVPSQVREGLDASREAIGARYGQLDFGNPVDTRGLAEGLDDIGRRVRGPAQSQVRKVRGFLDEVPDPNAPPSAADGPVLSRDAGTLFETRQAIDGLLSTEVDPKAVRQLTIARQSVDEELQHAVPGLKQVDGQFQEIARQDDALTRGGRIFDNGKTATHPNDLMAEIQAGAIPQGQMVGPSGVPHRMQQGARAEVDRLVGTHVNDLNTLERTLATPQDWNSQKFAALFGEDKRNAVADELFRNRRFRQSYQDIVQGSQTAQRNAAQRSMDGEIDAPFDTTAVGLAATGAKAVWRALVGLSKDATKDDIGRILAKQGPDAARIMEELMRTSAATRARSQSVAQALGSPALAGGAGNYGGRSNSR